MIDEERSDSGILLEEYGNKEQLIMAFYNEYPTCDCEVDITGEKIFEAQNPYWLADTFVFCKKHYTNVFSTDNLDIIVYIKVNYQHRIEEIGTNFESRVGQDYESILSRKDVSEATNLHKMLISMIDNEYWLSLYRIQHPFILKQKENKI